MFKDVQFVPTAAIPFCKSESYVSLTFNFIHHAQKKKINRNNRNKGLPASRSEKKRRIEIITERKEERKKRGKTTTRIPIQDLASINEYFFDFSFSRIDHGVKISKKKKRKKLRIE